MFDSDVAEISEPSDDVGPRTYRFEPRRVQRNVQEEANEKQPRVRRIAFKTLTGNCFNCDLLAFFVVNAYDRQYLVRIKANPIHVFLFLLFVLFCLSFFVLAVSVRCECGICQPMPTAQESVCYTEISRDSLKVEDQRPFLQKVLPFSIKSAIITCVPKS